MTPLERLRGLTAHAAHSAVVVSTSAPDRARLAGTSQRQVPALLRYLSVHRPVPALLRYLSVHRPVPGPFTNIDLGAGRHALGTAYLRARRIENVTYDPFALPAEHNEAALRVMRQRVAHTATVANVLNVMDDEARRWHLLALAASSLRPGGLLLVMVHEGDRSGVARGNQLNRPAERYRAELAAHCACVERRGTILLGRVGGR